tara:strand:+ start:20203 stop:21321 length:1119 start_codon:yes stop_codon:yes gene_type:complete
MIHNINLRKVLSITSPTLVLNESIIDTNIKLMKEKAEQLNVEFRPHFKTHQSKYISESFKQQGVTGITVSSVKMAEYFSEHGWMDITIAFPINILEIDNLNKLPSETKLNVLVVDEEVVTYLDENIKNSIHAFIELDPSYGRSGMSMDSIPDIQRLKNKIDASSIINFAGFYLHAGHTYKCKGAEEVREVANTVLDKISKLKQHFNSPVCYGDTPSCSVLEDFRDVTQISPGNFVFYDWMQVMIGSCKVEDIALALYCPVVAKYKERNEILIHGGAVHLSKEFLLNDAKTPYYGVIAETKENGWGNVIENCFVKSISQEHGLIACSDDFFDSINIGDLVPILPIHSCLTADLMGSYLNLDGVRIDHLSSYPK